MGLVTRLTVALFGLGAAVAASLWLRPDFAPSASPQLRLESVTRATPLHFEANRGQSHPAVDFQAAGPGYRVFLTSGEAVVALSRPAGDARPDAEAVFEGALQSRVIRMQFVGSSPQARPVGTEPLRGMAHYLRGNDPAGWIADVPTFARVRYEGLYPGVDLVYYGSGGRLEYDFVVSPGADPGQVRLRFEGGVSPSLERGGDLVLESDDGRLQLLRPRIYQRSGDEQLPVDGGYRVADDGLVAFDLGPYDPDLALTIDPILVYSSYLGGSGFDSVGDVAVDADGNAYVTGGTGSANFPLKAPLPGQNTMQGGTFDAFVAKFDPSGQQLLFSTYLGGNSVDLGNGIDVDTDGNIVVVGQTESTDFPTVDPFQDTNMSNPGQGFPTAFVTRINADGDAILFSTYFGGQLSEWAWSVELDSGGNICFGGRANSADFPTTQGVVQPAPGSSADGFVAKFSPDGSNLLFSTYLGGTAIENFDGLAVSPDGTITVIGQTFSTDFPTTVGSLQPAFGGGATDAYVTRLSPDGKAFVYSTYLGGSGSDVSFMDVATDSDGNAYVTGRTGSANFPLVDPIPPGTIQFADAFVSKINPDGSALVYSTFLGGSGNERPRGIAVDPLGQAVVTGQTESGDFPLVGALPGGSTLNGASDAFVSKLNTAGNGLVYSTYMGGSDADAGVRVAAHGPDAFIVGTTSSTDFPVASFQETAGGAGDAFVARLAEELKVYFAQFGNGGGLTSDIVLTNPDSDDTVRGRVDFFGSDGSPLSIGIASGDGQLAAPQAEETGVDFEIGPLDAVTISTDGEGATARVGAAVVSAGARLGGVIRFSVSVFDLGIAGVADSQPLEGFITPVRRVQGGVNTGVALHNPGSSPVDLTLKLLQAGAVVAMTDIDDFPGHGHQASFIDEQALFKTYFDQNNPASFVGTLVGEVTGGQITVTALEQALAAGQFTTLPVTPLN